MSYKTNEDYAFPCADYAQLGMTLRDYFAAKAMQTFLNDPVNIQGGETWADYLEDTAKSAYEMANAMIKARNAN